MDIEANLPKSAKVICLMKHGSHLYGLNTEDSDVDYKGVFIPSKEDAILGLTKDEYRSSTGSNDSKNGKDDIDVVYYSIGKLINMLCQGETIAIDMIHCTKDCLISATSEWHDLVSIKEKFYTRNMKAFLGYVKKQAHKYGVRGSRVASIEKVLDYLGKKMNLMENELKPRLDSSNEIIFGLQGLAMGDDYIEFFNEGIADVNKPIFSVAGSKYSIRTPISQILDSLESKLKGYGHRAKQAKDNEGVDWKAMSHAIRCGNQLREIYMTGDLKYPLSDRDFLLKVKQGDCDFLGEVEPALNAVVDEVESLAASSDYPDRVDKESVYEFVRNIL